MRLPQQQPAAPASARARPAPHVAPAPRSDERRDVRPSFSSGGTADCYARCAYIQDPAEREECMLDCY